MNKHIFNRFLMAIFISTVVIFLIFIVGIVNNDFIFELKDSISYFDIAAKISTPLIAVFLAIYYSTTASNYQKISAIRSLLSDLSKERTEIMNAVDEFTTMTDSKTSEIRRKLANRYGVYGIEGQFNDAFYELKKNLSSISSPLYLKEFAEFKIEIASLERTILGVCTSIDNETDIDREYTLCASLDAGAVELSDSHSRLDLRIKDEIEHLKILYANYRIELFS